MKTKSIHTHVYDSIYHLLLKSGIIPVISKFIKNEIVSKVTAYFLIKSISEGN